jgi:tRNA(fMet)-specific endonuclease VapC
MSFILDTNTISKAISGRSAPARRRLQACARQDLLVPTIVIAELAYGARKAEHPALTRARWEEALAGLRRVAFDEAAAEHHARLRWELRHQPIGGSDLLIAAIAYAHQATVVTNNLREFTRITGLAVEDWTTEH